MAEGLSLRRTTTHFRIFSLSNMINDMVWVKEEKHRGRLDALLGCIYTHYGDNITYTLFLLLNIVSGAIKMICDPFAVWWVDAFPLL